MKERIMASIHRCLGSYSTGCAIFTVAYSGLTVGMNLLESLLPLNKERRDPLSAPNHHPLRDRGLTDISQAGRGEEAHACAAARRGDARVARLALRRGGTLGGGAATILINADVYALGRLLAVALGADAGCVASRARTAPQGCWVETGRGREQSRGYCCCGGDRCRDGGYRCAG